MMKKWMAFLLVLIMTVVALPVNAYTEQKEPMVLKSKKQGKNEAFYYYDERGNCVREEGPDRYTEYVYNEIGVLVEQTTYCNGELDSYLHYDDYGNLINESDIAKYALEYDMYGRLAISTSENVQHPNDPKRSIRYEYDDGPIYVEFGHYEQDGDTDNGPESIEWIVLDADGENLLLVSRYLLDKRSYYEGKFQTSWKNSAIRTWLNGAFLDMAFDYAERYQIQGTEVEWNSKDKVFLLSQAQVNKYFANDAERSCTTAESKGKKAEPVWWYLRGRGASAGKIMGVNPNGSIDKTGKNAVDAYAIRPAIWVSNTVMRGSQNKANRVHTNTTYFDTDRNEEVGIESSVCTYDKSGNLICVQDYILGSIREWKYDKWNNIIAYQYTSHSGITSQISTYQYNALGQPLSKDEVITETDNDNQSKKYTEKTKYTYDNQNRLVSQTSVNQNNDILTETWNYQDEENTVVHTTVRTGKSTNVTYFVYDDYGNLIKLQKNGSVTEYTYVPLHEALLDNAQKEVPLVPMHEVPYTTMLDGTDPVFAEPDGDSRYVRDVRTKSVYTIVEEAYDTYGNLWGKLKSGLGWVMLENNADMRICPQCGKYRPKEIYPGAGAEQGNVCNFCSYDNVHGVTEHVYCPGCGADCTYRGLIGEEGLCSDCYGAQ